MSNLQQALGSTVAVESKARLNRNASTGVGWSLLAFGFALPWLVPVHSYPWPTLYNEVAAGLALLPLALWAVTRRTRMDFDILSLGFAAVALVPLLQAAGGMFAFPGEAPVISVYLLGCAVAVAIARSCEALAPGRLPDALFAGFVIAALASTALALAQWLLLDWGSFMAPISIGNRPMANVGQSNELSTLLLWGLIGLWWAHARQRIGGWVAILAAATLLLGIASTQSRTGWLGIAMLLAVAWVSPASLGTAKHRLAFVGLGLWFAVLAFGWTFATDLIGAGGADSLGSRLRSGLRPEIWSMMIDGIHHRPWLGYGWNQGRLVQVDELPQYADLKMGIQHAHNLVLDLMLWNGVPLGLAIASLLGLWLWWQVLRAASAEQILILLAIGTFTLHALFELPHCKAFFLVPVALMMGILNARSMLVAPARLPLAVSAALVIALASVLLLMWKDYRAIELDVQSQRLRAARIGVRAPPPAPEIHVLNGLQAALVNERIEPREDMPADEIERLRLTARRYPEESALLRYAKAAALNGQSLAAQDALRQSCLLFPHAYCDKLRIAWGEFASEHPRAEPVPFPRLDLSFQ
ncbi:Wzy polymerase domain-containing protein [Variovorax guangxiensis]|uniref:PglL family O-oligosaccharyltransferase n=1 Tax=Variovorax guangxiensis TaxID=1775474 RepID=UPI00285DEB5B|nr:Wzy polymerase domain-containing protein [Variovorax guangxiensis]MDR6854105.1 O-antigen ligase [Variovorax guangxiensis]